MNITLTREEAQQVLDALEAEHSAIYGTSQTEKAIETLRARLAQPEPEPVGYVYSEAWTPIKKAAIDGDIPNGTPLYTAPPQRNEWQGLTSSERKVLWLAANNPTEFGEMLEAKLKEKNA